MTEAELAQHVQRLAHSYGIRAVHMPDSRRVIGGAGMPDWILLGPNGLIWRELKSEEGQLSGSQILFHRELAAAGQNVGTWRPAAYTAGYIQTELRAIGAS
jgi:hypothetical protein